MDDKVLIQEIKKGSLDGIRHVYMLYYPELVKHAYVIMKDKAEAEDIVQECLTNILSKPDLWRTINDLRWYLGRSVHNLCMWHLRRRNAQRDDVHQYSSWVEARSRAAAPEVLDSFERIDMESKVRGLLSLLAPRGREAIKLVYLEGLSYAEASSQMGISKNSLKTHLKLAMAVMRKVMQVVFYIVLFRLI